MLEAADCRLAIASFRNKKTTWLGVLTEYMYVVQLKRRRPCKMGFCRISLVGKGKIKKKENAHILSKRELGIFFFFLTIGSKENIFELPSN